MNGRSKVIIIGGGFGGLSAAQALKSAPVDVTLIDRRNYHLFQPLLYQVATGSLSPGGPTQTLSTKTVIWAGGVTVSLRQPKVDVFE
jgi:NADH dehydrogenase FAD-containing subunit